MATPKGLNQQDEVEAVIYEPTSLPFAMIAKLPYVTTVKDQWALITLGSLPLMKFCIRKPYTVETRIKEPKL